MKKQQQTTPLTIALLCTLPWIGVGKESQRLTPEQVTQAIEELVDEQPEIICEFSHRYALTIEELKNSESPQRLNSAVILAAVSMYADSLEGPEAFTAEERRSSREWQLLLTFFNSYKPTETGYQQLPETVKKFLTLTEEKFTNLYRESKTDRKLTVQSE